MIKQNEILSTQERLNMILDKVSKFGIKKISKDEKFFLDSFSIGKEDECNSMMVENENSNLFISDDGIFKFKLISVETESKIKYINGIIIVPDISLKKRMIKGELKGSIMLFTDNSVALDFTKGKYDIFEFVGGLEYELDCFVDDIVSRINDI